MSRNLQQRKIKYDQEFAKSQNREDNSAEDILSSLALNCSFYLKKAKQKLDFLETEAMDPDMSHHNLGSGFRKGMNMILILYNFKRNTALSPKKY